MSHPSVAPFDQPMAANTDLLEELRSSSFDIEEGEHPYERASEEEQAAYDKKIEFLARQREARERAAQLMD
jgi:hypothetical protein